MSTKTKTQKSSTLAVDASFDQTSTPLPPGSANALNQKSSSDFQHVSEIWQAKCQKSNAIHEILKKAETQKFDMIVSDDQVRINSDLKLSKVTSGDLTLENVPFTEHGLSTLCSTVGVGSTFHKYMVLSGNLTDEEKSFRSEAFSHCINYDLDQRNENWLNPTDMKKLRRGVKETGSVEPRAHVIRLRNDVNGNPIVRAVVSEKYTTEISNLQVMDLMLNSFPNSDQLLVSHFSHDGDNMIGNLLVPDWMQTVENDSDYGMGISFKNSEVKTHCWEIRPFLYRAICMNGCIWGRKNATYFISKKHLGNCDLDVLRVESKRVIDTGLSHGQSVFNLMMNTKSVEVANPDRVFAQIADDNKLSKNVMENVLTAYLSPNESKWKNTGFGIIQAMTAGAQQMDDSLRNTVESIAGDMLAPSLDSSLDQVISYWNSYKSKADMLSEREYTWVTNLLK